MLLRKHCIAPCAELHCASAATLVDTIGTAAVVTISDNPGVSTHISTEYFAPVAKGDVAVVEATVLQHGKRLCNVEVSCCICPHSIAKAVILHNICIQYAY